MKEPDNDMVFKLLFGAPQSKVVLISLLSSVLKPPVPISEVTVLNPEVPKELVADKGIKLDLRLDFEKGQQIDVEMQSYPPS